MKKHQDLEDRSTGRASKIHRSNTAHDVATQGGSIVQEAPEVNRKQGSEEGSSSTQHVEVQLNALSVNERNEALNPSQSVAKKGKEDDAKKGKEDDAKKEKEDDAKKGKEDDAKKEKEDDAKKGKEDDAKKGKEDDAKKEKEDDAKKGKEDAAKKEKEDDAKKGKEDAAKKGKEDAAKKEKEDDAKKEKEDDAKETKSSGRRPTPGDHSPTHGSSLSDEVQAVPVDHVAPKARVGDVPHTAPNGSSIVNVSNEETGKASKVLTNTTAGNFSIPIETPREPGISASLSIAPSPHGNDGSQEKKKAPISKPDALSKETLPKASNKQVILPEGQSSVAITSSANVGASFLDGNHANEQSPGILNTHGQFADEITPVDPNQGSGPTTNALHEDEIRKLSEQLYSSIALPNPVSKSAEVSGDKQARSVSTMVPPGSLERSKNIFEGSSGNDPASDAAPRNIANENGSLLGGRNSANRTVQRFMPLVGPSAGYVIESPAVEPQDAHVKDPEYSLRVIESMISLENALRSGCEDTGAAPDPGNQRPLNLRAAPSTNRRIADDAQDQPQPLFNLGENPTRNQIINAVSALLHKVDSTTFQRRLSSAQQEFRGLNSNEDLRGGRSMAGQGLMQGLAPPTVSPHISDGTPSQQPRQSASWTNMEYRLLSNLIFKRGLEDEREIASYFPNRTPNQVAKALYYFFPSFVDQSRHWSNEEHENLFYVLGSNASNWDAAAESIPGRSAAEIKRYFFRLVSRHCVFHTADNRPEEDGPTAY